ncbi:MAG: acyltransferase, partial [SAR86 cluster bacterium]
MNYRPEIDGLRAMAILPVVFFHLGWPLFNGGYIGVDIFFVISGYLISTLIIKEIDSKKFSLLKFYERRIRRIFPALFLVTVVTMLIGWFLMLPSDFKALSQSVFSVSIFSSNIFFWLTNPYFSPPADLQPLLHTWSLSVEEQFYLLYPALVLLCLRLGFIF